MKKYHLLAATLIIVSGTFCQKAWPYDYNKVFNQSYSIFNYDVDNKADIILYEAMDAAAENYDAVRGVALVTRTGSSKLIADACFDKCLEDSDYCISALESMPIEIGALMQPLTVMGALEDGVLSSVEQTFSTAPYCGLRNVHNIGESISIREAIASSSNTPVLRSVLDDSKYESLIEAMNVAHSIAGYGVTASPEELLRVYDAIAAGGVADSTVICSPETAASLRQCLSECISSSYGTGKYLRNGYVDIAGKTATTYPREQNTYNTDQKILSFVGYFPADKPQYTCIVVMQCRGNSHQAAMDVFKRFAIGITAPGIDYDSLSNSADIAE